jgi:hypothetical protein
LTSQNNPQPSIKEFLALIFVMIALVGVLYISFWDSAGEAPSGSSANIKPNTSPPQVAEPDSSGTPPTLPPCDTEQRAKEVWDEAWVKCAQWSKVNCARNAMRIGSNYEKCKEHGDICWRNAVIGLGCIDHWLFKGLLVPK